MTSAEFLYEIETLLETGHGKLTTDVALVDIVTWDSMAGLMFIGMVEEKLGVVIEGKSLAKAKSVGDLVNLAKPHLKD